MPQNRRSLQLIESYRSRLFRHRELLESRAARLWPVIGEIDSSGWAERMAAAVEQAQAQAVRLTGAYLTEFLRSETRRRMKPVAVRSAPYVGRTRDGRPLAEAFRSPLIATLTALKDGVSASDALHEGQIRGVRMAGVDFDHAHRSSLLAAIDADDRFDGWQRSLAGTCGACAAVASGVSHELHFAVHPSCQCVAAPRVRGVPDTVPILTGAAIFEAKSKDEQDEMVGPAAAAALREGSITLADLHGTSPMAEGENFITQKPLIAVT